MHTLKGGYPEVTEVVIAFVERGRSSESMVDQAVRLALLFCRSAAAVA